MAEPDSRSDPRPSAPAEALAAFGRTLDSLADLLLEALDRLHAAGVPASTDRIELWIPLGNFDRVVPGYGKTKHGPDRGTRCEAFGALNARLEELREELRSPELGHRGARRAWRNERDEILGAWLHRGLKRSRFGDGELVWHMGVTNTLAIFDLKRLVWLRR